MQFLSADAETQSAKQQKFRHSACLLEDHIIPWVKQWRVGCGLMGEQGAESLHATFNNSERSYNNMTNRVERLRVVLQNNHFKLLPCNTSLEPPPLKRRKKKGSSDDSS